MQEIAYFKTAFILLIPAAELSSFIILKVPNSLVFLTCGPPHISVEKLSIV